MKKKLSRRDFMKIGAVGTLGVAAVTAMQSPSPNIHSAEQQPTPTPHTPNDQDSHLEHGGNMTVGDVNISKFDPMKYVTEFDYGKVSKLPNGQTLREWDVFAVDQEIEIAPGIFFPA
ncbi:MAG: twin-arginine translocation signal domain-containing protein, partial [Chloroflexi bacterium]|nr:twin-arginine translocation signal domain-containing protein [Chloroflexota bacterium]